MADRVSRMTLHACAPLLAVQHIFLAQSVYAAAYFIIVALSHLRHCKFAACCVHAPHLAPHSGPEVQTLSFMLSPSCHFLNPQVCYHVISAKSPQHTQHGLQQKDVVIAVHVSGSGLTVTMVMLCHIPKCAQCVTSLCCEPRISKCSK